MDYHGSAREVEKTKGFHRHICETCAHQWDCLQGTKCKVETAAKVNGAGPFCELCLHLELVKRHASVRGLSPSQLIDRLLKVTA